MKDWMLLMRGANSGVLQELLHRFTEQMAQMAAANRAGAPGLSHKRRPSGPHSGAAPPP